MLQTTAIAKDGEAGLRQLAPGLDACRLVRLPTFVDDRGNLAVIEAMTDIPFEVKRVYYLYQFTGAKRGGHAHKRLQQLFIALSGSFDVVLDDGRRKKTIRLSDPAEGLYICPMIWREIENFSPGSVCLVLASTHYDERDYFRTYEEFVAHA
jgi:dTDP-4-dehydrorhamnose 3,5-epimerase-like enzyme